MSCIREKTEQIEAQILSNNAVLSANSKGRIKPEEKDDIRTDFQRDRDRIIHCKSFRRLKHKTQVFLSPESDHYRTRMTHTLEVAQIARTIAREAGVKYLTFNSAHTISAEDFSNGKTYADIMENNLEVIREALN